MHRKISALTVAMLIGAAPFFLTVPAPQAGLFSSDQAGTAGAQFLTQGPGSRPLAMGDAYCAVADDSSALFWNPAGLVLVSDPQIHFTHGIGLENTYQDFILYAQSIDGWSFGAGLQYASMTPIDKWGEWGESAGQFQPFDLSLAAAGARAWDFFSIGAGLKGFWQDLDGHSAQGFALDLGGRILFPDQYLVAGIKLENIGPAVKFQEQSDPLPFALRMGAEFKPFPEWIFALDLLAPAADSCSLHVGGEYCWQVTPTFAIRPRAGVKTVNAPNLGLGPGFSCGLGLEIASISVDYAWLPFGDLGSLHRLSLGVKLGSKPLETPAPAPTPVPTPAPTPAIKTAPVRSPEPEPPVEVQPALDLVPSAPEPQPAPTPVLPTATEKPKPLPVVTPKNEQERWMAYYLQKIRYYLAHGKYFTAKTYYDQAVKLYPNHPKLAEVRKEIERNMSSPNSGRR